jgi:hypothetical protein
MEAATMDRPDVLDGQEQTDDPGEAPAGMVVQGTGQLSFDVGGKSPTGASLSLTGGKVELEGQFAKGETVVLRVEAVVHDVGFKDTVDSKTGQVVGCERRQKARIVSVTRVEE